MLEKSKEGSKEDRKKLGAKGRVFSMTHNDAKATSEVLTSNL